MVSEAARSRAIDRIARSCDQELDATSLRLEVLEELRRALGYDAFVWVLTYPHTCVGAAPLADVPCRDELPRFGRAIAARDFDTVSASVSPTFGSAKSMLQIRSDSSMSR